MQFWQPTDLLGFANLFDAVLGIEQARPWPGTGS